MARRITLTFVAFAGAMFLSTAAYAQSAIVGVVKDSSGAAMPGVTVEAASDVLIEKVKSATSDSDGAYRIADLRPGSYSVTFTLTGFKTFRRDGVVLPAEFTATINAELGVGALEETITVTGASPVVDVTSAAKTSVLNREALDLIPTGRSIQGLGQLVVGVSLNLPDTGGARAMQQTYMSTHGMSTSNTTVLVDGQQTNGLQTDGGVQSYYNDAMNSEMSYQTAAIGAETSSGGVRLNMIPREGGNQFHGDFKMAQRPGSWQASNLTQRHLDNGLTAGNAIDRIIDYTASFGGPIKKDKVWFFTSARYFSVNNFIANTFMDDGSQGIDDQFIRSAMARLTWQASPRNKISGYFDEIDKYRGHDMQANYDPETAATVWNSPAYHTTAIRWTSPATSSLFLEAGFSNNTEYYTNEYREGIEQPRGTTEWFAKAAKNELDLGGYTQAGPINTTESPKALYWNGAATYVTGDHTIKFGANMRWGTFVHTRDANADLVQQYRGTAAVNAVPGCAANAACVQSKRWTVPDTVLIRNSPLTYGERLNKDLGIFLQDSWRLNRLTVNYGIRWETLNSSVMAGESPAGRFVPARTFTEVKDVPSWNDWAPRLGIVYDLFGTGKTAVKASINRYNLARTTGIAAQYNPLLSQTATLPWRDVNGDDIAQGSRNQKNTGCYPSVGCEINFDSLSDNYGIAALNEYGKYPRTWNFEQGVELSHELMDGLSLAGSYWHGDFHNLTTSVNRQWSAADYSPYTWYNPITGAPFTVYARSAAATSRPISVLDTYDPERKDVYESYGFDIKWRIPGGGQVNGGMAVERERLTSCTAPDDPNYVTTTAGVFMGAALCDDFAVDIPWRPQFKLNGTKEIKYGINVSMSFQNNSSPTSSRLMAVTRGTTRYPANCPSPCPAGEIIMPTATFGQTSMSYLLESPRASSVERIVQLDLKVAKTFRFGRYQVLPTFEVFNINNSDAIISYISTSVLSSSYLAPNSIMQGRMYGFGVVARW
ncbi:MAG TPA: carboxypeptidase regulatory-like domain-containing protein [Vicinamibacterales bacterium]|nr:carboxypeptidase regulatory-like domain-containing protein [Vicinamibacterales bacterium]